MTAVGKNGQGYRSPSLLQHCYCYCIFKEKAKNKKKYNYFSLNWVCLQDSKCFWVHLGSGLEWSALLLLHNLYPALGSVSGFEVIYHPTQGCLSWMPLCCTVQVWGLVFINVVSAVSDKRKVIQMVWVNMPEAVEEGSTNYDRHWPFFLLDYDEWGLYMHIWRSTMKLGGRCLSLSHGVIKLNRQEESA